MNKLLRALKREGWWKFSKLVCIRSVMSLFAFPIALIMAAISPWLQIRLIKLFSYRIGHYALNTELLLCAMDSKLYDDGKKTNILFYADPAGPVCNKQLHRMWKRAIRILPVPSFWNQVDRFLMMLLGARYSDNPLKILFESADGARDQWDFLERIKKCHISFTPAENRKGRKLMEKLGIPADAPFICLLGRDPTYLQTQLPNKDWSYHDYRDVQISHYQKMADFLVEKGYYVIRMGKHVKDKFISENPQVIDYANHTLRSDFMDIYLSAHCFFFISPRTGIDAVAQIFRRPLLLTNFPLCDFKALYFLNLFIPKKMMDIKSGNFLTFNDMCGQFDRNIMKTVLQEKGWCYVDNTPDEIVEAVEEMVARLTNTWKESDDNTLLQEQFWQTIPLAKQVNSPIKMRIGDKFIRNHQAMTH